ncbi:MAG: hypothetical protein ACRELB_03055 [Polyangiaceae bacterium]
MKPYGPHSRVRLVAEVAIALAGVALLVWAWRADRAWFEMHVGEEFCTVRPEQEHARLVWRWVAAALGSALLLGVRPLAGRWASRRSARAAAFDAGMIAAAALLALVVSDLVLRRRRPTVVLGPQPPPSILPPIREDPRYGWSYTPGTSAVMRTGDHDVEYAIDALGDRARSTDAAPDLAGPTILLVGESFASGIGVSWRDSLAGQLQTRLAVPVVDSSVWGFDHGQEYLRMRDVLPRLAHPLAVVVLTVVQQVERDGRDSFAWHPRFTVAGGSLEPLPRPMAWWTGSALRQRLHDVVPLHDDAGVAVARALLSAMAREARARGAYPLLVLTNWGPPCMPDATGAPASEHLLFDGVDAPHVRVDLDPSAEDPVTHHPTPRGQGMLADAVVKALVAARVVSVPAPAAPGPAP